MSLPPSLRIALSAMLLLAAASPALAAPSPWAVQPLLDMPGNVTLSGSARIRYESLSGQPRAGLSASDQIIMSRITLFGRYDADWLHLVGEIYDSRTFGGKTTGGASTSDVNALEPVQAYAQFSLGELLGTGKFEVQAGRFFLALGSRRLLGAEEFRNTINSHTGLRADFSAGGGVATTLYYVMPHIILPDDKPGILRNSFTFDQENFDLTLWGGHVEKPGLIGAGLFGESAGDATYVHLDERDAPGRPTRNRQLDTVDGRLIASPKAGLYDYEAEAAYQTGTVRDGLAPTARRLDVSAWYAHLQAGYTFAAAWKPHLSLLADYASGDGNGASYTRFDTLYGMRRGDFAPPGLYNALGRANMVTPGIRVEAVPSTRFDFLASYRALWLASRYDAFSTTGVRDASGRAGNFAGHQIEGRMRYWLVPDALQLEANAAFLFKGRQMLQAPNSPSQDNTVYGALSLLTYF